MRPPNCGTKPIALRAAESCVLTSWPETSTVPDVGPSAPVTIPRVVVLPLPFTPRCASTSPLRTPRERLFTATFRSPIALIPYTLRSRWRMSTSPAREASPLSARSRSRLTSPSSLSAPVCEAGLPSSTRSGSSSEPSASARPPQPHAAKRSRTSAMAVCAGGHASMIMASERYTTASKTRKNMSSPQKSHANGSASGSFPTGVPCRASWQSASARANPGNNLYTNLSFRLSCCVSSNWLITKAVMRMVTPAS
mmetsp:Transcript_11118/g.36586  ORF Transcript_11118/g.36586 Transcript_11118/m.36586 type:complete len:253 (+) Transcript_11118:2844-3602(+)